VGVLVCRPFGRDPRQCGSGRTGGTNVYRTAGLAAGAVTALLDGLKGFAAVYVAQWLLTSPHGLDALSVGALPFAVSLAALGGIVGHNHSCFAGFRGGAGTSPNLGAILRIDPVSFAIAVTVALATLATIRIASVASLVASGTILLLLGARVIRGDLSPALLIYAVGQLALVTWALRPNIQRLRAGSERRIGVRGRE
jgi:glycerol-3-phosphate acyltransferase PlsY